jgi:hypothetical protein
MERRYLIVLNSHFLNIESFYRLTLNSRIYFILSRREFRVS